MKTLREMRAEVDVSRNRSRWLVEIGGYKVWEEGFSPVIVSDSVLFGINREDCVPGRVIRVTKEQYEQLRKGQLVYCPPPKPKEYKCRWKWSAWPHPSLASWLDIEVIEGICLLFLILILLEVLQ